MRISAPASALDRALSLAALAAAGKTDVPVCITADRGTVRFNVTNTQAVIAITATCAATVIEPGTAITSAARLSALLAGFPPRSTIEIATAGTSATVAAGKSRYSLALQADAPIAIEIEPEIGSIELSAGDVLQMMSVLPAAETARTRPYLCGALLRNVDNRLHAVATTGSILLRVDIAADELSLDNTLIIPTSTAATLSRLLRQTKPDMVRLTRSRVALSAAWPGIKITSGLIAGPYPDMTRVIPAETGNTAPVQRADLAAALNRLAAVALPGPSLVALSWSDGGPLQLCLPRQPGAAEDAVAGPCKGAAQMALMLAQLAKLIGEFDDDVVDLEATDRGLLIRQGRRLGYLVHCQWNFETKHAVGAGRVRSNQRAAKEVVL
jgi:DNA polymerase III sliding clamp (beta) subunit (PCNA family)